MNQLSRAAGLKIAAVILWIVASLGMIMVGIPALMGGRSIEDPFYFMFVLGFAVDALTILVGYGVWRAQRWGIILAILISAFSTILNTGGVLLDPDTGLRIMAGTFVLAFLTVIYLCLRREPASKTQPA